MDVILEKIINNVKIDANGCWLWKKAKYVSGYGRIYIGRKGYRTHRIAFERTYGAILGKLICCHICDNPICCNPEHLRIGTHNDNVNDRVDKDRSAKGERHGSNHYPERVPRGINHCCAKLTESQIIDIRNKYAAKTYSMKTIAKEYNISDVAVYKIIHRKSWKHV